MIDFVQLMDHLSIGTAVIDPSLHIVFWNKWMAEHSLISREEAMGRPIHKLFPELVKKGLVKKAREVIRSGQPVFFTHKVHQAMFPFHAGRSYLGNKLSPMQQTVILSPIKTEDDITGQVLISVFDITDWVTYQNQLLKSKKELETLSHIDDLTQIPNRRNIMTKLRNELILHTRRNRPLALVVADIDHFKKVNDTYGHQCGDFVLNEIAHILSHELRGYDELGRYGGEEFLLILPETSWEQAILVCERLRIAIEESVFRFDNYTIRLTISLGVAFKDSQEKGNPDKLFKKADACLYKAKERGRNQVVAMVRNEAKETP
ncbi:MAG: GGDEF domain-containing protein [Proteobacteria bacterium]|nr:GGDEF domain-containing protein [Pseudomonadota bacterium]MBU1716443.1 GGDEF domain-containing protein [Pseudomonadota bacterium]